MSPPGVGHGLPDHRPDGRAGVLRAAARLAAPRRLGLPPLPRPRRPRRPPPPPRPGARLPLYRLRLCLQRLHRHAPAGHPPAARRASPDPPRDRPGGDHRPARSRAGVRPQGVARPAAPAAARRLARPRAGRAARPGGGGRRDVSERGGKKASRTRTPPTRRGAAATPGPATAPGTTTGRRSAGSWAAPAAGPG
jgi:hypothetical protein